MNSIITKISLVLSIQKLSWKFQFELFIFTKANRATHRNKYTKFLIFGTETSIASSLGDSFFIIKYVLYHTSKASNVIHSHKVTL